MWDECRSCRLCHDTEDIVQPDEYPTPLFWGPEDAPVLIVGDAWRWSASFHLKEHLKGVEGRDLEAVLGDPSSFGYNLWESVIFPRLRDVVGEARAKKVAYAPAARCSFRGNPSDAAVARCGVYTKFCVEGRAMLVIGTEAYAQLGLKLEFESGRLITHERFGVVLMVERLHKLFDDPGTAAKLERGMEALHL